jgi:hypothetical protein
LAPGPTHSVRGVTRTLAVTADLRVVLLVVVHFHDVGRACRTQCRQYCCVPYSERDPTCRVSLTAASGERPSGLRCPHPQRRSYGTAARRTGLATPARVVLPPLAARLVELQYMPSGFTVVCRPRRLGDTQPSVYRVESLSVAQSLARHPARARDGRLKLGSVAPAPAEQHAAAAVRARTPGSGAPS